MPAGPGLREEGRKAKAGSGVIFSVEGGRWGRGGQKGAEPAWWCQSSRALAVGSSEHMAPQPLTGASRKQDPLRGPLGHTSFKRKEDGAGWRFVGLLLSADFTHHLGHTTGAQRVRSPARGRLRGPGFGKGTAGRPAHGPGCCGAAGLPGQQTGEPGSGSRFRPQREASDNTGRVSCFWFCKRLLSAHHVSAPG